MLHALDLVFFTTSPQNSDLLLNKSLLQLISVFPKTAGLSDKTGKFFCHAKIFCLSDSCPATLFNHQILILRRYFFFFFFNSFAFALCFLVLKKALKQYHLYSEIVFSNPKMLSVGSKICLLCRFSLCPIENFCLTDSRPVALQKFSRRL